MFDGSSHVWQVLDNPDQFCIYEYTEVNKEAPRWISKFLGEKSGFFSSWSAHFTSVSLHLWIFFITNIKIKVAKVSLKSEVYLKKARENWCKCDNNTISRKI